MKRADAAVMAFFATLAIVILVGVFLVPR
jgi:hypothetical protein